MGCLVSACWVPFSASATRCSVATAGVTQCYPLPWSPEESAHSVPLVLCSPALLVIYFSMTLGEGPGCGSVGGGRIVGVNSKSLWPRRLFESSGWKRNFSRVTSSYHSAYGSNLRLLLSPLARSLPLAEFWYYLKCFLSLVLLRGRQVQLALLRTPLTRFRFTFVIRNYVHITVTCTNPHTHFLCDLSIQGEQACYFTLHGRGKGKLKWCLIRKRDILHTESRPQ